MTSTSRTPLPATAAVLVAALAVLLACLAPAGAASAAPDGARKAITAKTYAAQSFADTNAARSRHRLAKFGADACLQSFADAQAARMARRQEMFHQDLGPIMRKCGLYTVGENVAAGFTDGHSVTRAWMNSPGHRANILNKSFRRLAVSARKGSNGVWYSAQVFGARR